MDELNIIGYVRKGVPERMMSALVEHCLQNYRKTLRYLQKHKVFEILVLRKGMDDTPPLDIEGVGSSPGAVRALAASSSPDRKFLVDEDKDVGPNQTVGDVEFGR